MVSPNFGSIIIQEKQECGPKACEADVLVEITAIFSKQDSFDWLIRLLIKPNVDILTFLGIQVLMITIDPNNNLDVWGHIKFFKPSTG